MYDKSVSESGKRVSEGDMSTKALVEAKSWADVLMNNEFKGRGDREKSVRGRLSSKTGIPESYLFRLQYKAGEMKDVAGEVYRRLHIAYHDMCARNEAAADLMKAERLELRNHHEAGLERPAKGVGMDSPDN
jgi:hypothetical protein